MKLTIVTVCLNSAVFLKKLIASLDEQVDQNFCHLVIDGGSTDGTLDLVVEGGYQPAEAKTGPRRFISEPDDGLYYAMNKGLDFCSTEFVMFVNSDDYLFDNDVVRYINHNLTPNKLMVGGVQYLDGFIRDLVLPTFIGFTDILYDGSLRRCPHPSTIFPLSVLRYDAASYRYAADLKYVINNLQRYSMVACRKPFSVMVRHPGQVTNINRQEAQGEAVAVCSEVTFRISLLHHFRFIFWLCANARQKVRALLRRVTV